MEIQEKNLIRFLSSHSRTRTFNLQSDRLLQRRCYRITCRGGRQQDRFSTIKNCNLPLLKTNLIRHPRAMKCKIKR